MVRSRSSSHGYRPQISDRCGHSRLANAFLGASGDGAAAQGPDPSGTGVSPFSGKTGGSRDGNDSRKAGMDVATGVSSHARLAFSLHPVADPARRIPPYHGVPVRRVQMQFRLLVLLGIRQSGERDDGGHRTALNRLAARPRMPGARIDGRRAAAAAAIRAQDCLLRGEEGILDLYRHEWPTALATRALRLSILRWTRGMKSPACRRRLLRFARTSST